MDIYKEGCNSLKSNRQKVIDPLTTMQARVSSDGVANALIQHQWRPKSFIFVCSFPETWDVAVTTSNNPKADFGMAHQMHGFRIEICFNHTQLQSTLHYRPPHRFTFMDFWDYVRKSIS
ncbi:hypothetical protein YC2023_049860 [Brassica napus]